MLVLNQQINFQLLFLLFSLNICEFADGCLYNVDENIFDLRLRQLFSSIFPHSFYLTSKQVYTDCLFRAHGEYV